jgi:fumarylacetoacetase
VFTTADAAARRRIGVAIGPYVLDASTVHPLLDAPVLNPLLAAGRPAWTEVRARLTGLLTDEAHRAAVEPLLLPRDEVRLHLPFEVADYADFYASEHHAANLGRIFRPGSEPLTPNWKHLPIGYHGRAGTVVVSGTPVTRPCGQRKAPAEDAPTFGPSRRLDIEAEVGFVVGGPTAMGEPVPLEEADDHVFGVCLVNDWSARDLQAWEYVPLGPFLGKSFATSVSPWIVPLDALRSARVAPPPRDTGLLPYLADHGQADPSGLAGLAGLDISLEVRLNGAVISRPPFASMYWTYAQMLAHMTANGASLRAGDLFASGTVSGPDPGTRGALIELTWNGEQPVVLPDGTSRAFLEDGDEVAITATAPGPGGTRIGFGEVVGQVHPTRKGKVSLA